MWCKQCQQDVPAIGSAEGGPFCCPRCAQALGAQGAGSQPPGHDAKPPAADGTPTGDSAAKGAASTSSHYDSWELDEQLRHIRRVLDKSSAEGRHSRAAYDRELFRLDPPHVGGSSAGHFSGKPRAKRQATTQRGSVPSPLTWISLLTWTSLSLGTMIFACGGSLLIWSVLADRPDLWNVGLPIAAGGQILLLVGLILQLDRLWHDNRHAISKLDHVDEQLRDLGADTAMLHGDHASPSDAFYAHPADGAGPQLLLTDLKNQLDLLATKLDQLD